MHLTTRNVNSAFRELVTLFHNGQQNKTATFYRGINPIVQQDSRNGPVLMLNQPIIITYERPRERVLFNKARDANPFFQLYEALWMLAGRNDVAPLSYYNSNIHNYSDDGKTFNGAYGYRWRHAYAGTSYSRYCDDPVDIDPEYVDQLQIIADHLKADPHSRRAVLQMWNVEDDLLKIGQPCFACNGLGRVEKGTPIENYPLKDGKGFDCKHCGGTGKVGQSKDVCCNLSVMFMLRQATREEIQTHAHNGYLLDMTVTNRSNDMIWGLLGTNYVHFSILQEYMAAKLGVEVGVYNHFTNNLHCYLSNWKPEEWLSSMKEVQGSAVGGPVYVPTKNGAEPTLVTLAHNPATFEREILLFVEHHSKSQDRVTTWVEPFLNNVAEPMFHAYHQYKRKAPRIIVSKIVDNIFADDWRVAARQWFTKRYDQKEQPANT